MIRRAIPVLQVTDSRRAERFYVEGLGFRSLFACRPDATRADPCYFGVERDGVPIHLSSFPGDGVSGCAVFVQCDEVDALHADFIARGIAITMPPTDQAWGNREMYLRDPDGNALRFVVSRE